MPGVSRGPLAGTRRSLGPNARTKKSLKAGGRAFLLYSTPCYEYCTRSRTSSSSTGRYAHCNRDARNEVEASSHHLRTMQSCQCSNSQRKKN